MGRMQLQYLAIVTLAALCLQHQWGTVEVEAKGTQIVDRAENVAIEKVAALICNRARIRHKQISRVQTIVRLSDHFRYLPYGHPMFNCRQMYGQSLEDLKLLVTTANQDVCSEEKLALMERFHRQYVSSLKKHRKERQLNGWRVPRLARLFFMHYAQQVARVCEASAARSLARSGHLVDGDAAEVDALLKKLEADLSIADPRAGYQRLFLFWNFIERLPFKGDERLAGYITDDSNGIKLSVSVNNAERLQSMRGLCQAKFKPLYATSVLPVLRLIDMGYYPEGDQLVEEMESSGASRRLFKLAQLCEIILPIRPFNDASLAPGSVNVLRAEEADRLSEGKRTELNLAPEVAPVASEPGERSMAHVDKLERVTPNQAGKLIGWIQANIDSRNKAIKLLLGKFVGTAKSKIKSKVGAFFVSGKKRSLDLAKLSVGARRELADDSDDSSDSDEDEEDDNNHKKALVRRKRGFFRNLGRETKRFVREHKVGIAITVVVIVVIIIIIALLAVLFIG